MASKMPEGWKLPAFDDAIRDFIAANDRAPRDDKELMEWCRRVTLARLFPPAP